MACRILIAAGLVAAAGCGKKPAQSTAPDSTPAPAQAAPAAPPVVATAGGGAVAPNQNGNLTVTGGQGPSGSPRMAVAREANHAQMKNLHLSMFQTWQLDNRVPTADEVMREARQNSQLFPLLKDEVVILTGTTRGDGVWAYSRYPQRAGEHYVITQQGVEQMAPEGLRKRLEDQQSPVKLAQ